MANNLDAFVPEIWDAGIIRTRETKLVMKQICRRNPDAPAKKKGDIVHYSGLADLTINTSYSGTMSYEDLQSAGVDLLIDKNYNFGFHTSDIEKAMMDVDVQGSQNQRGAYQLQKALDTHLMSLYDNADPGNVVTDATLDATTAISTIGLCAQRMEEADIPEGQRWITIPPWIKQALTKAGIKFQIKNGIQGGISWTDALGLDVYMSNQVHNAGTAAAPHSYCMFGSYDAIVYHEALLQSYALRDKDAPDQIYVSQFCIFGAKVIRPKELGYLDATYAADTTI